MDFHQKMDFQEKMQCWSREAVASSANDIKNVSTAWHECLGAKYAPEILGAVVVVAAVASRGRLTGLAERVGLSSGRAIGASNRLVGDVGAEAGAVGNSGKSAAFDSLSSIKFMPPPVASFASRTGIRSASGATGKWFDFKSTNGYLNVDRNSDAFHREISEKFGVDLEKIRDGKVAVLHPRFKNPEKQLLGKAVGDVGVWGDRQQGVGVVQYESLPSTKGYLTGADSVVRVTQRAKISLPETSPATPPREFS